MTRCAPLVGRHVLARLVRGGVGGIRGEMGQACFKTLSMLFKSQIHVFGVSTEEQGLEESGREGAGGARTGKKKGRGGNLFGLSTKQLRALLVVLQMAVAETEHQNATFTLIKAVVSRRVMLPEVYDLMTKLADLAVTSHRPTLRATAGQTFLTFLLQYPLGEKRLQFHLNQVSFFFDCCNRLFPLSFFHPPLFQSSGCCPKRTSKMEFSLRVRSGFSVAVCRFCRGKRAI